MMAIQKFRFQTGSIKSAPLAVAASAVLMFRFQTGSIKSYCNGFGKFSRRSFDSKLVRLKVTKSAHGDTDGSFDSKLVRLKELQGYRRFVGGGCFDSKLVRLKGTIVLSRSTRGSSWFRFQTGSIKRRGEMRRNRNPRAGFDSKLVRLKGTLQCTI